MQNSELLTLVRNKKVEGKTNEQILQELSANYPNQQIAECLELLRFVRPADQQAHLQQEQAAYAAAPQPQQPADPLHHAKANSPLKPLLRTMLNFFIGLLFIALVGFVLGLIGNGGLVSKQGEYFGELADTFSMILFIPIPTLLFGFAAAGLGDKTLWGYPLLAFSLAGQIDNTSFVEYVGDLMPIDPHGIPQYTQNIAAVMIAYITIYIIVKPLWGMYANYRCAKGQINNGVFIAWAILFAFGISTVTAGPIIAQPLADGRQRNQSGVHLPNTDQHFATGADSESFVLNYGTQIKNYEGKLYYPTDIVRTTRMNAVEIKEEKGRCGQDDSVKYANTINKKTTKGVAYSEYTEPTKEVAHQWNKYCVIVKNTKYVIARTGGPDTAHAKAHPIDQAIDAIVEADVFMPGCGTSYKEEAAARKCRQSDIDKFAEFKKQTLSRLQSRQQ